MTRVLAFQASLFVFVNHTQHVITFRASGRPRYVTSKQELLVVRAITVLRWRFAVKVSTAVACDLTPLHAEVIVGAHCGYLLYKRM